MTSPQNPSFARRGDDPKMIGYWKVGRTIGKGSSGRVKVARHAKTGQMAAVKIIPKAILYSRMESLNNAADEAERFELALQREIVIMKLIDHPNIMKLYDVWDTTHHLYLILEHVQGGELFDLLCEQGRLSSQEALRYFQQIIAALDYLHRFNIVHRDLKPENILLDAQRNVKLADFGMAAWQSDSLLQTSCGSPHYAAPEIVNGLEYDGAISDIWSCGIILHAMLAGHLPFDDEDCTELLEKVRLAEFEMPQEIEPLAQDLISKMLTKDVSMRITISGIQSHPFFTSESFDFDNPPPLTLYDLALPIASPDEIDLELLRHLHTLWPNSTDEELISCLVSEERNCHKGIYQLLTEYRRKELEDYDEAEELAKVERLRRQTFKAQRREQETARREHRLPLGPHLTPSPSSIPPRNDPPTPRRAARSGGFSASSSEESLLSKRENRPEITLCSPSNSGRSSIHAAEVPLVAPEHQDAHMRTFLNQVATHINVLYSRTEGPQSPTSVNSPILAFMRELGSQPLYVLTPDPPNQVSTGNVYPLSAGAYTDVKPLSVSKREQLKRATIIAEKENIDEGFLLVDHDIFGSSPNLTFHGQQTVGVAKEKRVRIVEPKDRAKLRKRRTVSDTPSSPSSPVSPSRKRNWLAQMFKFKPSTYSLLSVHDVQTSQNECRRILMAMDVRVVLEERDGFGVLKCRLDESSDAAGLMAVLKAVKFRVDLQAVTYDTLALILVHEKGSTESLREIYRRLRQHWVMDIPGGETPQEVVWNPAHTPVRG